MPVITRSFTLFATCCGPIVLLSPRVDIATNCRQLARPLIHQGRSSSTASSSSPGQSRRIPFLNMAHLSSLMSPQAEVLDRDIDFKSAADYNARPSRAHLLGLPADILKSIIALAVIKNGKAIRIRKTKARQHKSGQLDPTPALAHTCTQLRAIALPMYYGQNTFVFMSPHQAVSWFGTRFGTKEEKAVRHVFVKIGGELESGEEPIYPAGHVLHVVEMVVAGDDSAMTARVRSVQKYWWQSLLKDSVREWVQFVNEGRFCERKPGDHIPEICQYISVFYIACHGFRDV